MHQCLTEHWSLLISTPNSISRALSCGEFHNFPRGRLNAQMYGSVSVKNDFIWSRNLFHCGIYFFCICPNFQKNSSRSEKLKKSENFFHNYPESHASFFSYNYIMVLIQTSNVPTPLEFQKERSRYDTTPLPPLPVAHHTTITSDRYQPSSPPGNHHHHDHFHYHETKTPDWSEPATATYAESNDCSELATAR